MFESDIERSKIRLLELVNTNQSTVYLSDILGRASVDYAYKQYFEAEFGWWLYEEQTLRQTNPNLDHSDAATQTILSSLDSQYRKNARFDREQLMVIIDSAVKSVLNFRVRPRTTLKWFVYRGEPTKPVYEVYLRMRYFADYRYLHEGFNQWLLKRGLRYDSLDIISVLEFERLIKKIDDDTILELSPSQFVDLISPIITFFSDSSSDVAKQTIPIEALIIFLDDKEVYIIAQKLERMLYQQGIRQLTKEMFLTVVDEVLNEVETDPTATDPSEGSHSNTSKKSTLHGIEETPQQTVPSNLEDVPARSQSTEPQSFTAKDGGAAQAEHTEKSPERLDADQANIPTSIERADVPTAESTETDKPRTPIVSFDPHLSPGPATSVIEALSANAAKVIATPPPPPEMDVQSRPVAIQATESESVLTPTSDSDKNESGFVSSSVDSNDESLFVKNVAEQIQPKTETGVTTEIGQREAVTSTNVATDVVENVVSRQSVPTSPVDSSSPTSPEVLGIISRALQNESSVAEVAAPSRSQYFENAPLLVDAQTEPMRSRVYPSLKSFYDDRQRESYVKKLCGKDENRFMGLVQSIDATNNWKEALAFLDKFYSQESIDPQSSVARDFRMAVYKRFIAI